MVREGYTEAQKNGQGKSTGMFVKKFREVLNDNISKETDDMLTADEDITVVVNGKTYKGDTIARSLMVDLIIKDMSDPKPTVRSQGSEVPIADIISAHALATTKAQLIVG